MGNKLGRLSNSETKFTKPTGEFADLSRQLPLTVRCLVNRRHVLITGVQSSLQGSTRNVSGTRRLSKSLFAKRRLRRAILAPKRLHQIAMSVRSASWCAVLHFTPRPSCQTNPASLAWSAADKTGCQSMPVPRAEKIAASREEIFGRVHSGILAV
jgi:hypothetical protein